VGGRDVVLAVLHQHVERDAAPERVVGVRGSGERAAQDPGVVERVLVQNDAIVVVPKLVVQKGDRHVAEPVARGVGRYEGAARRDRTQTVDDVPVRGVAPSPAAI